MDPPSDPLDKFLDDLKQKVDADKILDDVKLKIDNLSTEAWESFQDLKILDDKTKEAYDLVASILKQVKQFDMNDLEYNIYRPILLLLLKRIQEFDASKNIVGRYSCSHK